MRLNFPVNVRLFDNPQAANAFTMNGMDSALFNIPLCFQLTSPDAAAEMIEVYIKYGMS